ncbi:transmembrane protein [Cryptosporidium xiaoi]|uniref:Transmembrane protein n=1 Tax=Cryptosporidium xiaoi TaxID=659607 RepID=A0AAV9Y1B5_9CRYT
MGIFEPRNKRINVLYLIILLIFHLIVKISGQSGVSIYSSLPEYVVEWLKRHIFFEIKYIKDEGKVCTSGSGPYCKHIYRMLMREYSNLEDFWRIESVYTNNNRGYGINFDNNKNGSQYLHIEYRSKNEREMTNANNQMERLVMLNYTFNNNLSGELNVENKLKNNIIASENDYKILYTYCKLDSKRWFHCLKILGKSAINIVRSKMIKYTNYLKFETLFRIFNKYFIKRKFPSRLSKLVDYYHYIENYKLPDKDASYQVEPSKEYNEWDGYGNGNIISESVKFFKVPIDTGILFDDTFSKLLVSKSIRTSLVSTLTWILDQKSAYIEIWNNWRNERLNRRYIIGTEVSYVKNNSNLNEYMISPFTRLRISNNDVLFDGKFTNNYRIIRKTWNGVSLKMNFNIIKPNVKIIPSDFCSDYNMECKWEGVWEAYYNKKLGLRLLSRKGKFHINSEKFVLSDFPITFFDPLSDDSIQDGKLSEYKDKYITISGYNGFVLMWKSHISISGIINERNKATNNNEKDESFEWINALEFSNTIPYSLIDSIQFDSDIDGVVIGPFVFNLLNPAYNYVSKNNKELINIPVEIDQTSELSLVINLDKDETDRNSTSVSITTMYLSKASPLISLYNIQNKGLDLENKVNESTKCVIKRNLAELTTNN